MNVLITAGGTTEYIDKVRGITNFATGRLGLLVADKFIENNHKVTLIYAGKHSPLAANTEKFTKFFRITTTNDLKSTLKKCLESTKYDCVIHSMAVSDYTPCSQRVRKIASNSNQLNLRLKRLPKLIRRIKKIQPDTLLVGFKLLSGKIRSEQRLVAAANRQMKAAKSDFVLANFLEDIDEHTHKAILINEAGIVARCQNKAEIARVIYENCYFRGYGEHSGV
ncbi:MAG: hypothetical protein FWG65_07500 [Turicibacter sp.]|nr:hypothetical protein [Turicibacter sp.]